MQPESKQNVSKYLQIYSKSNKKCLGPKNMENIEWIGPPRPSRSQGWAAVTNPRAQRMHETWCFRRHIEKHEKTEKSKKKTTQILKV